MSINATVEIPGADDQHKKRMDRMYKVQRHIYDVTRAYYLLGRNERIAALRPPAGGSVLEIGCGTGRNLVELARCYPEATIFGVDISDEMLVSAVKAVIRQKLHQRVKLAQGDATNFDGAAFDKPVYDRVLFSYTLSMIPDWERALGTATDRLAPGGELHVVDFGTCNDLPDFAKSGLHGWLRRFHVTPRTSLFAYFEHLAERRKMTFHTQLTHRGYAQHAVLRNR